MGGDLADVRLWAGELSAVHERFVHRFSREEPRQSALAYMRGLIAPLERKNGARKKPDTRGRTASTVC